MGRAIRKLSSALAVSFVLSGFLMYRPILAARELGASPVPAPTYLRRRAAHVLPAYWLALACLAVYSGLEGVVLDARLLQFAVAGAFGLFVVAPGVLGANGGGVPRRVLAIPALSFIGVVAYGAYVGDASFSIHLGGRLRAYPWFEGAGFTAVLTVAMVLGAVVLGARSFHLVKRPFLRRKERKTRRLAEAAGTRLPPRLRRK